jgi:hypothetical protein
MCQWGKKCNWTTCKNLHPPGRHALVTGAVPPKAQKSAAASQPAATTAGGYDCGDRRRYDREHVWKYFGFDLSQEHRSVEVVQKDGARPWLCLTPGCEFRVHSDPKFGCWCCKACARAFSDAGGDRDRMWSDYDERWWPVHHGPKCEHRRAPLHFRCNTALLLPEYGR